MSATPAETLSREDDDAALDPGIEERKRKPFWRELPVLVVIAFVVALFVKTFLLQAFYIPSASMEPTLVEGDRVLVEKVSYRFGEPERGDVVVFEKDVGLPSEPPDDDSPWQDVVDGVRSLFGFPTGDKQDFIKRVVAVEGDTIEGSDGKVLVNGTEIEEEYLPPGMDTSPFGPAEVPPGMLFVMGDNRANSDDSRAFGAIERSEVVGRAFVLIWPPSDVSGL
ncbi:MAG: signal peptidase I [Actinomycetota bacterium]|nr:signal peptidase I [Actinomycetota bacterium]